MRLEVVQPRPPLGRAVVWHLASHTCVSAFLSYEWLKTMNRLSMSFEVIVGTEAFDSVAVRFLALERLFVLLAMLAMRQ